MKEQFLKRMQSYLKEEYDAYEKTLEEEAFRGIRINTSKISTNDFLALHLCETRPSSICKESFYIPKDVQKLGNHPAHLAGLFYMQEPSASSAVEVLDVQEGDWVLDMCSAPGGKSTQIAAKLNNTGFLVSNEIEPKRALVLMSNMERLGFSENMITNARPDELAKEMSGWFDKVLVDAPCSGEGMFKKHAKAMDDWSVEHVVACANRQRHILQSAYEVLKEDGILVYSTCTYSMEENEEVIASFLNEYPDMELLDANVNFGRGGFPCEGIDEHKVVRIFPMDQGEGHFVAKLKKHGSCKQDKRKELANAQLPNFVTKFFQDQLTQVPSYVMQLQDKVYLKKTPFIKLKKVRILRQGLLAGEMIKNRFEPHQHFYTASMNEKHFKRTYDMSDEECLSYLQGNLLQAATEKGYVCLTWHQHPIAFSKADGMVLKNKYPKGMRIH